MERGTNLVTDIPTCKRKTTSVLHVYYQGIEMVIGLEMNC